MRTLELREIVQEEAEIMEPENASEARTRKALWRALDKLERENYDFTSAEKSAIIYALEDLGELYMFAGSSAGFDVESKAEEVEHQSRGTRAREQAYALGIIIPKLSKG